MEVKNWKQRAQERKQWNEITEKAEEEEEGMVRYTHIGMSSLSR